MPKRYLLPPRQRAPAVAKGVPVRVTLPTSFQADEAVNGNHVELVAGRQPTFLPLRAQ